MQEQMPSSPRNEDGGQRPAPDVSEPGPVKFKLEQRNFKDTLVAYGEQFKIFTYNIFTKDEFNSSILTKVAEENCPSLDEYFEKADVSLQPLGQDLKNNIQAAHAELKAAIKNGETKRFGEIAGRITVLTKAKQ